MKKIFFVLLILPIFVFSQNVNSIQLDDVDGENYSFRENLTDDGTIIVFWATWCLPCKKEFPAVQAIKDKYEDKEIQIVTISIDSPRSLAKVKMFVRSHEYDFTYLLDPSSEVKSNLLVNEVPTTFVVNSEGKIVFKSIGYRKGDEQKIEEELKKLW